MWRTGSHGDDAAEETGITATADAGGQAVAPGGDEGGGLVVHQSANRKRKTISVNADDVTLNPIDCAGIPSATPVPSKPPRKSSKRKDTSDGTAKQSDPNSRKRKEGAATTVATSSSKKSKVGEVINESIKPIKSRREFERMLKNKLSAGSRALGVAVQPPNPEGFPTAKDVAHGLKDKLSMKKVHEVATSLRMNDSDSVSRLTHKYIYLSTYLYVIICSM